MGTRPRQHRSRPPALGAVALVALVAALGALAIPSCGLFAKKEPPAPRIGPNQVLVDELQSALVDAGDEMIARVAARTARIIDETDDTRARQSAMSIRSSVAIAIVTNIGQVNPLAALLDMMLMARLTGDYIERFGPEVFGEFNDDLLRGFRRSEEAVLRVAEQALTPEQIEEFYAYVAANADLDEETFASVNFIRVSEFDLDKSLGRITGGGSGGPRSVFQLLYLDPLAGLDQSAREMQQTRMLAERGMYTLQRHVQIVSWEVETLWRLALDAPEVQAAIGVSEDIAASTRRFADVAERLRGDVNEQMRASVAEMEAAVARQRVELVEDVEMRLERTLDRERRKLVELAEELEATVTESMRETRLTVEASERLAASARELVETTDRFVSRFKKEGEPPKEPSNRSDPDAWRDVATEIAIAAEKLTLGIEALEGMLDAAAAGELGRAAAQASDAAAAASQGVINAVFWRAVILILLAAVALFATLVLVGSVARRRDARAARAAVG
jgi:predicted transcriptional regulator